MNKMTRSFFLVAALSAACTSNASNTRDDAMSAAESKPASVTPAQANAIFAEGFDAADPERALTHFDDDVVWFLTNGAPVRGKAAVAGFVEKGRSGGAGDFDFSNSREIAAGEFAYVFDDFAFDLNADKRVEGTRYALWHTAGGDANLLVDAWMPSGPHDEALAGELAGASQAMADAINGDDAAAIAATYTQDAVVVLSNGTTHRGDALGAFFTSVAEMDIDDMRVGAPSRAVRVGDDTAYAVTSWAFTVKTPDGNIPLGGERVMVWKQGDDGAWRAAMELSWPKKK